MQRIGSGDVAVTRLRKVRYDIGARSSSVQLDGIDRGRGWGGVGVYIHR